MVTRDLRAGDLAWCAREAVRAYGGGVLLVSVTAPGADVLPLGSDGRCRFDSLASWAGDFQERWNRLSMRGMRRACKRRYRSPILVRRFDVQARGAPHIHVVVKRDAVGFDYAYTLKRYASEYGFGFVDVSDLEGHPVAVAQYAAGYVGLNLTGERYGSSFLPSRLLYGSREWSAKSGADMSVAREIRRPWVYRNVTVAVGFSFRYLNDEVYASKVLYHARVKTHGVDKVPRSVIDWSEDYETRRNMRGGENDESAFRSGWILGYNDREDDPRGSQDVPQPQLVLDF